MPSRRQLLHAALRTSPLLLLGPMGCFQRVDATGRRQFAFIDDEQMDTLADQSWEQISAENQVSSNTANVAFMQQVGQHLASVADNGPGYDFTLFASEAANAFALPNGRVAVFSGMLPFCKNGAGLATVLGHEIAHVQARHGNERLSQQFASNTLLQLASIGLGAAEVDDQTRGLTMAALSGISAYGVILPYSRTHEYEADKIGTGIMARAGYDPQHAVAFWQRFQQAGGGQPPEFMSTHPSGPNRIERLQDRMPHYQELYQAAPRQLGAGEPIPSLG
ncbi:MAG: M48 family metallopeptidase [Planctomycetota bacterium]